MASLVDSNVNLISFWRDEDGPTDGNTSPMHTFLVIHPTHPMHGVPIVAGGDTNPVPIAPTGKRLWVRMMAGYGWFFWVVYFIVSVML